jgi:peptidoglycan/LPS O-acetylase OafA/YrhL
VNTPPRVPLIDALKAIASQLIVLHHLAFYGPMSEVVRPWAGALVDGLAEYGRLAVQVFLVIAGWLAAGSLAPGGVPRVDAPGSAIGRRWMRLAGPYVCAVAIAVAAAALARAWTDHDTVPGAPTMPQLLANLAMLQDVLGYEALSAGLWYVAIDLQLYACLVAMLWLTARTGAGPRATVSITAGFVLASLLIVNRDPAWDAWAPYFFGSYGLGALAAWSSSARSPRTAVLVIAMIGALALWVDFRTRIAVALATALLLAWAGRAPRLRGWPDSAWLGTLGRISYSVFLVHYPVCVLFNAAAARWFADAPLVCAAGLVLAFVASTLAGFAFHRWVELPLSPSRPARR